MINELLPPAAVAVEAFDDLVAAPLFPQEEAYVVRAVAKRRFEFATGRRCAREALAALDFPHAPLLIGDKREPLWPQGAVGSITHCVGYRAAAVARAADLASLGIDAEPHEPLPEGVLESIALPEELARMTDLYAAHPDTHWDRLLFSAKESVYKTWFPLAQRWLDFHGADITFDPPGSTFSVRLTVPGPIEALAGRYIVGKGLALTAIWVAAQGD